MTGPGFLTHRAEKELRAALAAETRRAEELKQVCASSSRMIGTERAETLRQNARANEAERLLALANEAKEEASRHATAFGELLETRNRDLALAREALREQWESNHAEHCGKPWPHDGDCYWPQPEILVQLPQEGSS